MAPALRTDQIAPSFSKSALRSTHNVSHGFHADKKLEQPADELGTAESGNTSGPLSPLARHRLPKFSKVVLHGHQHPTVVVTASDARGTARMRGLGSLREFFHMNQVLIYMACSGALTVLVMVFTLATVYGGRQASRSASEISWRRFAESYPLIDQRPLLLEHGSLTQRLLDSTDDDDDDEQVAVHKDDEDVDTSMAPQRELGGNTTSSVGYAPSETSEGPWSARWSLPGDPPLVIIKSKQGVKRPIEVFPSRLLDLCNQEAPLTFLAFLPNGNQHRSKWLAHGRNSEVFQLASVLRRTVLKVVPVTGDLTEQQVDTIASAIECCLIACVFDQFPEWLLRSGSQGIASSSESLTESLASDRAGADGSPDASDLLAAFRRWKGTNQCCLTRHFIVFELSYAGKPLSRITLRSAVQGRSLVRQAACCVAVAERALGFRHTGVDADKLLVAVTDAASLEYRLPNRTTPISIESAGLKAHLAGDREAPSFYGNVMWLGAVVDCVLHKVRSEVPENRARTERAVLDELISWQARLQQCNCAHELVATMGI
ncbi:hypothetical protein HPB52_004246 [Rhipicephalus sanguineus]|uniref:Uncharacterized protein n=1 Tax=Rhipicephalus sanguineus TaxID=34632 RepID=A0A9D4SVM2_RHISA|nr:hypothetical protein HPB52_004246 [Rhipicephalus sanguineus]